MRAYTLSLSPSLPHSWKKKYIKSYMFHARKISNISVVNYRETPHACLHMHGYVKPCYLNRTYIFGNVCARLMNLVVMHLLEN